jgi:hypothetical protein
VFTDLLFPRRHTLHPTIIYVPYHILTWQAGIIPYITRRHTTPTQRLITLPKLFLTKRYAIPGYTITPPSSAPRRLRAGPAAHRPRVCQACETIFCYVLLARRSLLLLELQDRVSFPANHPPSIVSLAAPTPYTRAHTHTHPNTYRASSVH